MKVKGYNSQWVLIQYKNSGRTVIEHHLHLGLLYQSLVDFFKNGNAWPTQGDSGSIGLGWGQQFEFYKKFLDDYIIS